MTRSNNYDALRLLGAAMVIVGHAYHLVGRPFEVPGLLGYPISTFGVVIFFSISGYLITISWTRTRDLISYSAARCLRIFPALIVVVLFCTFLVGPLVTTLSTGDYFSSPITWQYLWNIPMRMTYTLPGVFEELPYANAVNGSLWTLPAEFLCYLVVPIAAMKTRTLRVAILVALLAGSLWLSQIPPELSRIYWGTRISDAASMWVFFVAGMMLATAQERWGERIFRADTATVIFSVFLLLLSMAPAKLGYFGCLTLPYVVLVVGRASTPYLRQASRYGDFSYGLYLWGFPVQQLVVHYLGPQRMAFNLPLVFLITTLLAVTSWHLIENPSMRLKTRITRGRRKPHLHAPPAVARGHAP